MDITTVCILGGTGFVGRHLSAHLCSIGYAVTILTGNYKHRRDLFKLPGITLIDADIHNPDVLDTQFARMDAVINLVGILNEKRDNGLGFEHAHIALTQKVIDACKKTGVKRLLHMSALHADAESGPSYYLRSKGRAEEIALAAESGVFHITSFRPSVIFGPDDGIFNRFAGLLKITPLAFPLACPNSRFAPVYVGDVSEAFARSLKDGKTFGRQYDLCGPEVVTLKQLVEYTAKILGLRRSIIGLPDMLSRLQAFMLEFAPGKPFSRDNYRSLQQDSVCVENGLKQLGIQATTMDAIVPSYLVRCKKSEIS